MEEYILNLGEAGGPLQNYALSELCFGLVGYHDVERVRNKSWYKRTMMERRGASFVSYDVMEPDLELVEFKLYERYGRVHG